MSPAIKIACNLKSITQVACVSNFDDNHNPFTAGPSKVVRQARLCYGLTNSLVGTKFKDPDRGPGSMFNDHK